MPKRLAALTDEERQSLGRLIRQARSDLGYGWGGRPGFAKLAGISAKTLGTLEAGNVVADESYYAVTKALGLSPDQLEREARDPIARLVRDFSPLTPSQQSEAIARLNELRDRARGEDRRRATGE